MNFEKNCQVEQFFPIAIHFNLLQVCTSVPLFVFAVLLKPSFNVLSGYFYVSLNLVASCQWLYLAKFRDTLSSLR